MKIKVAKNRLKYILLFLTLYLLNINYYEVINATFLLDYMNDPQLSILYKWPETIPNVKQDDHGWFGNASQLQRILEQNPDRVGIIAEIGSWLGSSTRFMLNICPMSYVIAIDHWEGSVEHHITPEFAEKLPTLFETFLANCWDYRNRLIPFKRNSIDAIKELHDLNVPIDFFYIDASHDYNSVVRDIETCLKYYPRSIITGDDWSWESVRNAAIDVAKKYNFEIKGEGNFWWYVK